MPASARRRASALVDYVGLDEAIIDYVCANPRLAEDRPFDPVVDEEARLYSDQPDYAVIFSWHIADELHTKVKAKGFRGQ